MKRETSCPCGSNLLRSACCGPILAGQNLAGQNLAGQKVAVTALELMRSRYSAFVEHDCGYLLNSWHPHTRPGSIQFNPDQHWLGLKILTTDGGTASDDEGTVEFIARYKIGGRGYRLHEISRFQRVKNRWLYVDGERGPKDSG